jgi:very-short-patch-repair endonuclease
MANLGRIVNYHFHFNAFPETFRNARILRKKMTSAEKQVWAALRDRKLAGHKFRRQHPVGQFIVDFYCPGRGLIIEIDGGVHLLEDKVEKDTNRTAELDRLGLKVIRFTNEEVFTDMNGVLVKIKEALHSPPLQNGEGAGG